jgi:hypothetical protein
VPILDRNNIDSYIASPDATVSRRALVSMARELDGRVRPRIAASGEASRKKNNGPAIHPRSGRWGDGRQTINLWITQAGNLAKAGFSEFQ